MPGGVRSVRKARSFALVSQGGYNVATLISVTGGTLMQGGQMQFKIDQPGLIKAAPVALIVGAVSGALYIVFGLWGIAGLLGWIVPIFGGVWYVMTARKAGAMPAQMDGLVNGAIMGALVGLAHGILALITAPIGLNSAT